MATETIQPQQQLQHQESVLSQIRPAGPVSGVNDSPNTTEPVTVSYNTKVFNREIRALRNEEEALLNFQNQTRMRE